MKYPKPSESIKLLSLGSIASSMDVSLGLMGGRWTHRFCVCVCYVDVSKNRGTPKWMVKIMENPIKMDDLGGKPLFSETSILVWGRRVSAQLPF